MITLDILSDPICPWCYIGKTKLDRALAEMPDHPFDIRWRAFQLNPDMPPEGRDRKAYLDAKFGGPEKAEQIYAAVAEAAAQAGLSVDFSRIKRMPNTIDAHRLIRWARTEEVQGEVVDALFRLYFQEGADISDPQVLVEAGAQAGLDREVVAALLASDADREEVRAEDAAAREIGVSGVPTFLVGGKYVVQGAQEPELWRKVIAELREAQAEGVEMSG